MTIDRKLLAVIYGGKYACLSEKIISVSNIAESALIGLIADEATDAALGVRETDKESEENQL